MSWQIDFFSLTALKRGWGSSKLPAFGKTPPLRAVLFCLTTRTKSYRSVAFAWL
ncbi:hypothetical protein P886_0422 [Alteromonadaceae bacterium 2753L.S.0a.02]|nr:hypothetical protein P886_0422 [Alteromonadaceae bacterium 2753L.S.0a.02]